MSRKMTLTGLAVVGLLLGAVSAVLPTASAAAVSCRVFTAESGGYEGGVVMSKIYYVPNESVSGCKDINIRNIQNLQVPGDNCATFKVQFFPTWGETYYGPPKTVCSKGPNGPVVPIATNVLNGTKYRVLHNVENLSWTHRYQIVD
jgi:hypothetical protein